MQTSKTASQSKYEDYVEYSIYPLDWSFSKVETKQKLIDLKTQCLASISSYITQYMWHQSPFSLTENEDHLYGRIEISDNIEDEWYLVSLLFKLSELYPNIVINVHDQDGEVLLIEAADNLPSWAQDPESCTNRVYIYKNEVHLIPIAQNPSELTPIPAGVPSVEDAINTVYHYPNSTRASNKIQSVIQERIKSYPENWEDQKQYVHIIVPEKVKTLLHILPKYLISGAIRCFCARDILDIRKCRVMRRFPAENLVKIGLTLSKCLYAMLIKQEFRPDRRLNWQTPEASDADSKAADLGFKITCGLEILLSQYKSDPEGDKIDSNFDEAKYQKFEKSLLANGYFQNELEGSKKWNILAEQAKEYFFSYTQSKTQSHDELTLDHYSAQLAKFVKRIEHESTQVVENENPSYETDLSKPPDDDSWLNYEPDSFDEMLKDHFKISNNSIASNKMNVNEKALPSELKSFLSCVSNFEGVDSLPKDNEDVLEKINFDSKEFEKVVRKMAAFTDNNYSDESSDSESSEDIDLNKDVVSNDVEWKQYSDQLKNELDATKVMPSRVNEPIETLDDLDKPIDIDIGVFNNIMQSYTNENGTPGPATTLLQSLGLAIEPES